MKYLSLLMALLLLTQCNNEDGDCQLPPCAPPNLNQQAALSITFCTTETEEECFTPTELAAVKITVYDTTSDEVVTEANYEQLAGTALKIGLGSDLRFGREPTGMDVLDRVAYYYRIEVEATGDTYLLDQFTFEPDEPCSCPQFEFATLRVNDQEMIVAQNSIVLKQ